MSRIEDLLAARAAADTALQDAELAAAGVLLSAATAYRDDRNRENWAAYKAAQVELVALRQAIKADRDGVTVGGDAFLSPEQNEG